MIVIGLSHCLVNSGDRFAIAGWAVLVLVSSMAETAAGGKFQQQNWVNSQTWTDESHDLIILECKGCEASCLREQICLLGQSIVTHWVVMGARRECVVIADDFKGHGKELFCIPRWSKKAFLFSVDKMVTCHWQSNWQFPSLDKMVTYHWLLHFSHYVEAVSSVLIPQGLIQERVKKMARNILEDVLQVRRKKKN